MASIGNFTPAVGRFIANKSGLKFSVFKIGDDPQIRIRIAEQLFVHYDVPDQSKVSLATFYTDKAVLDWMDVDSLVYAEWEEFASDLHYEFHQQKYGFNAIRFEEHFQVYYSNLDKMNITDSGLGDEKMLVEEEEKKSHESFQIVDEGRVFNGGISLPNEDEFPKLEIGDEHNTEKEHAFEHSIEESESSVAPTVSSPNLLHLCVLQTSCEPSPNPLVASSTTPPQLTLQTTPFITTMRPEEINKRIDGTYVIFPAHNLFDLMLESSIIFTNELIQEVSPHNPHCHNFSMFLPPLRPPWQPPDAIAALENPLIPSPHWQDFWETLSLEILTYTTQCTLPSPLLLKFQPKLSHSMCQLMLDCPFFSFINFLGCLSQAAMRFTELHEIQVIMHPMNLASSFKCMIAPAHYGLIMATCFVMSLSCGVYLWQHIHKTVGILLMRECAIEIEEFQREVGKHMGRSSKCAIPNNKAGNAVPNGASSGVYEFLELRTRGSYDKDVLKAVGSVTRVIGSVLSGMDPKEQTSIDSFMVQQFDWAVDKWDGCKQKLGVKALSVVSLTNYKVGASGKKIFHYKHITNLAGHHGLVLLTLICKVSNINSHELATKEFMILHVGVDSFNEALQTGVKSYYCLKAVIRKRYGQDATNVAIEGDLAPTIQGQGLIIANESYMGKFITWEKLASDNWAAILLRILGVAEASYPASIWGINHSLDIILRFPKPLHFRVQWIIAWSIKMGSEELCLAVSCFGIEHALSLCCAC